MAQGVIPKKEEKVNSVFSAMENIDDLAEFKKKFKEMYPADWNRVCSRYNEHERRDTKGKGHPMPEPEVYLSNMFKVYRKKIST